MLIIYKTPYDSDPVLPHTNTGSVNAYIRSRPSRLRPCRKLHSTLAADPSANRRRLDQH